MMKAAAVHETSGRSPHVSPKPVTSTDAPSQPDQTSHCRRATPLEVGTFVPTHRQGGTACPAPNAMSGQLPAISAMHASRYLPTTQAVLFLYSNPSVQRDHVRPPLDYVHDNAGQVRRKIFNARRT